MRNLLLLVLLICGVTRSIWAQEPGPSSVSPLEVMTNRLQFDMTPVILCGWLVKLDKEENYGLFSSLEEAEHRLYASAFEIHLAPLWQPIPPKLASTFRKLNRQYVEIHADFKIGFHYANDRMAPFCGHLVNIRNIQKKQSRIEEEIELKNLDPFGSMPEWVQKKQRRGVSIGFEDALAHPRASHGDDIMVIGYWKQLSENVFGIFRSQTDAMYENLGNALLVNFKDANMPVSLEEARSLEDHWVYIRGSYFSESFRLKSCQKKVTIGRIGFITNFGEPGRIFLLKPPASRNAFVSPSDKIDLSGSWVHSVEELCATPEYIDTTLYVQGFVDNSSTPTLYTRYSVPNGRIFFGNSEFSIPKYQKYNGKAVLMRAKVILHNNSLRLVNEEILGIYSPQSSPKPQATPHPRRRSGR